MECFLNSSSSDSDMKYSLSSSDSDKSHSLSSSDSDKSHSRRRTVLKEGETIIHRKANNITSFAFKFHDDDSVDPYKYAFVNDCLWRESNNIDDGWGLVESIHMDEELYALDEDTYNFLKLDNYVWANIRLYEGPPLQVPCPECKTLDCLLYQTFDCWKTMFKTEACFSHLAPTPFLYPRLDSHYSGTASIAIQWENNKPVHYVVVSDREWIESKPPPDVNILEHLEENLHRLRVTQLVAKGKETYNLVRNVKNVERIIHDLEQNDPGKPCEYCENKPCFIEPAYECWKRFKMEQDVPLHRELIEKVKEMESNYDLTVWDNIKL